MTDKSEKDFIKTGEQLKQGPLCPLLSSAELDAMAKSAAKAIKTNGVLDTLKPGKDNPVQQLDQALNKIQFVQTIKPEGI